MIAALAGAGLALALAAGGAAASGTAGDGPRATPPRPVHTYSIVARDPETGEIGVAVQSHWFSVGPLVAWAEAGVGAVATQSFVDPSYGPLGLDLMRVGRSAPEALRGLLAADAHPEVRQVAMIDARGGIATHTGDRCIPAAGHLAGETFSVQANLMRNDRVWPAMAEAFRTGGGDLGERMLAALEAGEAAGGDIRGRQSAAIRIVAARSTGRPWEDTVVDLRVDDHPEPLAELRRLVGIHRAYRRMNAGDLAIERGDDERALAEYAAAAEMQPGNAEMKFWHAVARVGIGDVDGAVPLFRAAFDLDPSWAELLPRLRGVGLLDVDDATLDRLLGGAAAKPADR